MAEGGSELQSVLPFVPNQMVFKDGGGGVGEKSEENCLRDVGPLCSVLSSGFNSWH